MAQIIDGKAIAAEIQAELMLEILQLKAKGVTPGLGVILVGEDPASATYVRAKGKACDQLGLHSQTLHLPETATQDELLTEIKKMKNDSQIHGILVQLPLPAHIDEPTIIKAIPPEKDVDGFHPINKGKLLTGDDTFFPCTPAGVQELLLRSGNDPSGQHVVVVGRSQIVGLPVAVMLMHKKPGANATVTLCHSRTRDLVFHTRQADILIAAIGQPEFITADMLKENCVVIDVGVNRVDDAAAKRGYRLVGDVAFAETVKKVKAITPVPGGVGPMTIVMLMKNTVKSAWAFLATQKN
jgi:methylenetetrahydrofolate dehydrogenase (NADP+)/methenyltetrahydrofolate cyclohydrolase